MIIGKQFTFEAAHMLPGHPKCGVVHGHTYKVTVEVKGKVDKTDGYMFIDLHTLTDTVNKILSQFDHTYLNDYFVTPTCEYLAEIIFYQLNLEFIKSNIILYSVQVQEGEGGYARYCQVLEEV